MFQLVEMYFEEMLSRAVLSIGETNVDGQIGLFLHPHILSVYKTIRLYFTKTVHKIFFFWQMLENEKAYRDRKKSHKIAITDMR